MGKIEFNYYGDANNPSIPTIEVEEFLNDNANNWVDGYYQYCNECRTLYFSSRHNDTVECPGCARYDLIDEEDVRKVPQSALKRYYEIMLSDANAKVRHYRKQYFEESKKVEELEIALSNKVAEINVLRYADTLIKLKNKKLRNLLKKYILKYRELVKSPRIRVLKG